ncbi:MAG: phosphoribosylglycinamide formyltransferase [Flavobacteriales bacterium]|nr:MAG: phosphoribosylglycinamide formyltransferase [Flavobacteriales bacterium]
MHRIAIFASGSGTNAEKIIGHFRGDENSSVSLIVCNKPNAGVIERAQQYGIAVKLVERTSFYEADKLLAELENNGITFIVLAGFLWLIPAYLIKAFPNKIINLHPALLPKFGGKGMYGMNVHRAVLQSGEKESGITIHYVNEKYDEGQIIFQARCCIEQTDTPESLQKKVQQLEHEHFPKVIENQLS